MTTKSYNLAQFITLKRAKEYAETSEKWLYCTDILDACDLPRSTEQVEALEAAFDALLEGKTS